MAATGTEKSVFLKLGVDKENNRVFFAEAGKDFVDILLSFLSLPLGSIARLVGKESNLPPVRVGSLSSLYESVANLDNKHFWSDTCKEMLLQPRNSMESYCQNLMLNIDDTEPTKYFICENWNCSVRQSGSLFSTFKNKRCRCGKMLNREICLGKSLISGQIKEGFVHETASFIITDDLKIMPFNLHASVSQIQNLGIKDTDLEEMSVNLTQMEMLDLLKCCLLSKRALTDLFLQKPKSLENTLESVFPSDYRIGEEQANNGRHLKLKVTLRKSNRKVLFAQAEEDFADFLLSFLTVPLGGVENMLEGNSCSGGSFDNVYKSLADFHESKHLKSEEFKKMLINLQVAPQYKLNNQILPVDEVPYTSSYSCCYNYSYGTGYLTAKQGYSSFNGEVYAPLTLLHPNSLTGNETTVPFGFAKGPAMYMVTDDLVVTPLSFLSATSLLRTSNVPLDDLEEMVLSIGLKEGLSILKASLFSSSALTIGLSPFMKPIKEEN